MAKGTEDTAFYRYQPLISLNEVGGDPAGSAARPPTFTWRWRTRPGTGRRRC